MGSDPAFLFYPGDWMGGTILFSRAHKGAYMDLLMAQFNNGHLNLEDIKVILGSDFDIMWESKLKAKFIQDDKGLFFNEKLDKEVIRRKNYTASRKKNLGPHMDTYMDTHMDAHMETGNETKTKDKEETKDEIEKIKKEPIKPVFFDLLNHPGFSKAWEEFKEHRFQSGKRMTQIAKHRMLIKLSKYDTNTAINMLEQSMENGWQGVFELKDQSTNVPEEIYNLAMGDAKNDT